MNDSSTTVHHVNCATRFYLSQQQFNLTCSLLKFNIKMINKINSAEWNDGGIKEGTFVNMWPAKLENLPILCVAQA